MLGCPALVFVQAVGCEGCRTKSSLKKLMLSSYGTTPWGCARIRACRAMTQWPFDMQIVPTRPYQGGGRVKAGEVCSASRTR